MIILLMVPLHANDKLINEFKNDIDKTMTYTNNYNFKINADYECILVDHNLKTRWK